MYHLFVNLLDDNTEDEHKYILTTFISQITGTSGHTKSINYASFCWIIGVFTQLNRSRYLAR